MHSVTVPEPRCPKSECQQGWFLLRALRRKLPRPPSWLLLVAGSPCSCTHYPVSASIPTWPPVSVLILPGHQPLDSGPSLLQHDLILRCRLHLQRCYFQEGHILRIQAVLNLGGGTLSSPIIDVETVTLDHSYRTPMPPPEGKVRQQSDGVSTG